MAARVTRSCPQASRLKDLADVGRALWITFVDPNPLDNAGALAREGGS